MAILSKCVYAYARACVCDIFMCLCVSVGVVLCYVGEESCAMEILDLPPQRRAIEIKSGFYNIFQIVYLFVCLSPLV